MSLYVNLTKNTVNKYCILVDGINREAFKVMYTHVYKRL